MDATLAKMLFLAVSQPISTRSPVVHVTRIDAAVSRCRPPRRIQRPPSAQARPADSIGKSKSSLGFLMTKLADGVDVGSTSSS